ncbi:MAG TPA: iron-containing alcohol dehydrogenase [Solirubrobacteraceae bacterium]
MAEDFTWRDGERTIRFGRGALADAPGLLGEGYTLLTTERARSAAPDVVAAAATVVVIGPGRVDDLAGDLLDDGPVAGPLVALGGGRVIDVAKALGAAGGDGVIVAAIPTTLSAAEMTWVHRHARGVDASTPRLRPRLVLNDPALSASQPLAELAASAANALGHAVEGSLTAMATPVPTLAARDAARRLAAALPASGEPDRDELALGALLSGYAIDANWYGLHHVMSQTLVREAGAGHGPANAAVLPVSAAALRRRNPEALAELDTVIGEPVEDVARRFASLAGAARLRDIGIDESVLGACADIAAQRAELALTPPPAGPRELGELYREAW